MATDTDNHTSTDSKLLSKGILVFDALNGIEDAAALKAAPHVLAIADEAYDLYMDQLEAET